MSSASISDRIQNVLERTQPFYRFWIDSRYAQHVNDPQISDFAFGNPHEMPLPGFVNALEKWSKPQNKDWFAYKENEPPAQEVIAASLRRSHNLPFEPEDICLTNGAFGAIAVVLGTIVDPGDEIIYISPPWFFYEPMIVSNHGVPVRVACSRENFDLNLEAIRQAITPRTRGIIINSPNNPTGKIYPADTLIRLARLLDQASQENGRTVYLLSDEAYNHIVYDGRAYPSPTAFYPASFLLYTYGKTLLTPGQRIGYIALPPAMPNREQLRLALFVSQLVAGYAFPNALLQHALPDLETLSIDIQQLQARRDRLSRALTEMGYELFVPEGTFYLLVRSPLEDDLAFIDRLADESIYCLPGSVFELPGYFRISLTASDSMVDKALPGFYRALQTVRQAHVS